MNTGSLPKIEIGSYMTGNVKPLLHEIYHALNKLLESGDPTTIDLRALPLAPGEEEQIERVLGTGEVTAELDALGTSEIKESRFSGIWMIVHYNANREIIGKFIEITSIPAILKSQREDINDSLENLAAHLQEE